MLFTKPQPTQTVDGIISTFTKAIQDLEILMEKKLDEEEDQNAIIVKAKDKLFQAQTEGHKAAAISAKLKQLIASE